MVFASQEIISNDLKLKMIEYVLEQIKESEPGVVECKKLLKTNNIVELEKKFITEFPEDDLSKYLTRLSEREVH